MPDSAPHATMQASYRRIMRSVHPDVAGDDPRAVERALQANLAWAVLRDPVRRAEYDRDRSRADGSRGEGPTSGRSTGGGLPTGRDIPSWGPGGIRPMTIEQLREAAARESAYGLSKQLQRDAFSAASFRVGATILLIGTVLLALVVAR